MPVRRHWSDRLVVITWWMDVVGLGMILATIAWEVNQETENIGARRLYTVMEKLLEELSFEGPDLKEKEVRIDAEYVRNRLKDIVKDRDLSRFIL